MSKKRRSSFSFGTGRGEKCWYCERTLMASTDRSALGATRDHLYPKSQGGNFRVWCCRACNCLKGNMLPGAWRAFREANPEWWKLYQVAKRPIYNPHIPGRVQC